MGRKLVTVRGQKTDFLEVVKSYSDRHEKEAIDIQTLLSIASALSYVSQQSSERYFHDKRRLFKSWALAKDSLEGIIQELTTENQSLGRLLKAKVESLPGEIGAAVNSMREQLSSAIHNEPGTPVSQTEEFAQVKASAQDLLSRYKKEFDMYGRAYEELEDRIAVSKAEDTSEAAWGRTINADLRFLKAITRRYPVRLGNPYAFESALQILTEEARFALDEAATNFAFSTRQTTQVNAMLYLLDSVKTPKERTSVIEGLGQYKRSLAELAQLVTSSKLPLHRYLTQLNEVIAEVTTHAQTVPSGR